MARTKKADMNNNKKKSAPASPEKRKRRRRKNGGSKIKTPKDMNYSNYLYKVLRQVIFQKMAVIFFTRFSHPNFSF